MFYSGFADEASSAIEGQIAATRELGWDCIELRRIGNANAHDVPEADFEAAAEKLDDAGIRVNCFGSAVANWSCDPLREEDFTRSLAMLDRAIPRMRRLNCRMLRGMSFLVRLDRPPFDPEVEEQVFRKTGELVRRCAEAGITYVHENCRNYGGQSARHTLKLLEKIDSPYFKLVFDTGNPVHTLDRGGEAPYPPQSPWDFYSQVRDHVVYVHIKDAIRLGSPDGRYHGALPTMPGGGDGNVERILRDLFRRGYDGGFSMEPHLLLSYPPNDEAAATAVKCAAYVEYGRRFMRLAEKAKTETHPSKH